MFIDVCNASLKISILMMILAVRLECFSHLTDIQLHEMRCCLDCTICVGRYHVYMHIMVFQRTSASHA